MSETTKRTNDAKKALPPAWRWVRLRDVANVVNGVGFPEHLQLRKDLPYLFVKVSDMNAPGAERTISVAVSTVDDALLRQLGGRVYPPGTVVFPKVGGALLTNKKRILGQPGCFDNNVMGLVPNGIEPEFLYFWFCTVDVRDLSNTQALPSVRQSAVADLGFPLPPLPEQKRIAAILNEQMAAVERARAAAQAQLDDAKALPAAYLRQVFPAPGQALPAGWRWVRLGEVCELNPKRPPLARADDAPTTFVPMPAVDERHGTIATPEVRPYAEVKRGYTYFAEGDVLFAKITPCMQNGKHAIARGLIDGMGFGSTEFHVIRPSHEACSEWIHFFVRQPQVLQDATAHFTGAVGQQRVPDSYLATLQLPLPPLLEQKCIVATLSAQMAAAEKLRADLEAQLDEINALPAVLLRRAFNGGL